VTHHDYKLSKSRQYLVLVVHEERGVSMQYGLGTLVGWPDLTAMGDDIKRTVPSNHSTCFSD